MSTKKYTDDQYLTQKRLGLSERDYLCDDFSNEPGKDRLEETHNLPNGFSGDVIGKFDKEGNLEIISKSS